MVTYSRYRGLEIVVHVSVLYTEKEKKKKKLLPIPFSVLDFISCILISIPSLSSDSAFKEADKASSLLYKLLLC